MTKQQIHSLLGIVLIFSLSVFTYYFLKKNTLLAQPIPEKIAITHLTGENGFNFLKIKETISQTTEVQTIAKLNLTFVVLTLVIFLSFLFYQTKKVSVIALFYFFYFINIDFITRVTSNPIVIEHLWSLLFFSATMTIYFYIKNKNNRYLQISSLLLTLTTVAVWFFQEVLNSLRFLWLKFSPVNSLSDYLLATNTDYQTMNLSVLGYLLESGVFFLILYSFARNFSKKNWTLKEDKFLAFMSYILLILSFYFQRFLILAIPLVLITSIKELMLTKYNVKKFRVTIVISILILSFLNFRKFIRLESREKTITSNAEVKTILDYLGNTINNKVATTKALTPPILLSQKGTTVISKSLINEKNLESFNLSYLAYAKISEKEYYQKLHQQQVSHVIINLSLCHRIPYQIFPETSKQRFCHSDFKSSPYFKILAQTPNFLTLKLKMPQKQVTE